MFGPPVSYVVLASFYCHIDAPASLAWRPEACATDIAKNFAISLGCGLMFMLASSTSGSSRLELIEALASANILRLP